VFLFIDNKKYGAEPNVRLPGAISSTGEETLGVEIPLVAK